MRRSQLNPDGGITVLRTAAFLAAVTLFWLVLLAAGGGHAHAAITCPGTALTLAGDSPTDTFGVDDDLELQLNGTQFFLDNDEFAQELGPIHFSANHGDQLRVIASNSTNFGTGNEYIGAFALYCDANGAQQVLDATGYTNPSGPAGEVFYDHTFTIDFAPPSSGPTGQRAAALKKCKKKKTAAKRRKCKKRALLLPV